MTAPASGRRPIDPRNVRCPTCGAKTGRECVEIGTNETRLAAHEARRAVADKEDRERWH